MAERTIYVIINSDTDPAIEPINSKFDKETVWDTTINLIQQLKEELKRIDLQDTYPKIIWHLRSDEQIYKLRHIIKVLKVSNNPFVIFSTTFHPGDVLRNPRLFSIEYAIKNISYLLDLSKKENITVEFTTPDKVLELFVD